MRSYFLFGITTWTLTAILLSGCGTVSGPRGTDTPAAATPLLLPPRDYHSAWNLSYDRVWVGADWWPEHIAAWRIADGKLHAAPALTRFEHISLLRRKVADTDTRITLLTRVSFANTNTPAGVAGFALGLPDGSPLLPPRKHGTIPGLFAGVTPQGALLLKTSPTENRLHDAIASLPDEADTRPDALDLLLTAAAAGEHYTVLLQCFDAATGKELARRMLWRVQAALLQGHPGLACLSTDTPMEVAFDQWSIRGAAVVPEGRDDNALGPIVGAWHTVHHDTLRMTAQLMPVGKRLNVVKLQTRGNTGWVTRAQSDIRPTDYTATFAIEDWPIDNDIPYRLLYGESQPDGRIRPAYWSGTIKAAAVGTNSPLTLIEADTRPPLDVLPTADVQVYYTATPPPHTERNLGLYQSWLRWCFAHRRAGRNIPCLGVYHHSMTYRRTRIHIAESDNAEAPTPQDDWIGWQKADMKITCNPDMYRDVIERELPEDVQNDDMLNRALVSFDRGVGMVRIEPAGRRLHFSRLATQADSETARGEPYPGWPISCDHSPAYDQAHVGYLPPLEVIGLPNAVVQVIDESTDTLVYSLRLQGNVLLPRVFSVGRYTLTVGDPVTGDRREFTNLAPLHPAKATAIKAAF